MSYLTLDSSTTTQAAEDFTIQFVPPLVLETGNTYEIALIKANLWNSWYNISAAQNNRTLRYYNGSIWRTTTIPDGQYNIENLDTQIKYIMKSFGDYTAISGDTYYINLIPNYSTGKVAIGISNSYQLDLTGTSFAGILGYSLAIVSTNTSGGSTIADVTAGINSIFIHCDLCSGSSFSNGVGSDVLHTFVPQSAPNSSIEISPINPIYLSINTTQIQRVRMYITDQMGRNISFNGNPVTYSLSLRLRKN